MNERKSAIFGAIIKEHVTKGNTVASKVLVDKYDFKLSPATMRNEMVDLEKEGYIISTLTSGARALDVLRSSHHDLVLIDILMPTISGYELMALLREKIDNNMKIVFISIVPKDEVDKTGADGFIQKPFSNKSLLKSVKKALGEKK